MQHFPFRTLTDIGGFLVDANCSTQSFLEALNRRERSLQFALAVDDAGRLIGTITDGDVRRALLRGCTLQSTAHSCLHVDPIVGFIGEDEANRRKLATIQGGTVFLPVVDEARVVQHILVPGEVAHVEFDALVLAGGFGKRLGELTKDTPKPLLEVDDRPILDHILHQLETAGVKTVYVAIHYLPHKIREFFDGRDNLSRIVMIEEQEPLGTIGSLGMIGERLPSPLLCVNGDVLTSTDIPALLGYHVKNGYDALIAVAQYRVEIPFGVVRHSEDGKFQGIDEKPTMAHFVAAGVYVLSPEYLSLVRLSERLDMPELLERGRSCGLHAGLFPIHEYWSDVGRKEDLDRARAPAQLKSPKV